MHHILYVNTARQLNICERDKGLSMAEIPQDFGFCKLSHCAPESSAVSPKFGATVYDPPCRLSRDHRTVLKINRLLLGFQLTKSYAQGQHVPFAYIAALVMAVIINIFYAY